MHITDTHVTKGDDGKVTVEFKGEGGEAISVRMAASQNLEDDASVDHAKELMVQVATFGISDEAFEEALASAEGKDEAALDEVSVAAPPTGSSSVI